MAGKKVAHLTVGLQQGTERTVYARWSLPKGLKHLEKYEYFWEYYTGNKGIWFPGDKGDTTGTTITYSAPSNAVSHGVRVTVTPVAQKKPKKNKRYWKGAGTRVQYKGGWCEPGETKPEDTTPSAPGNVDIEISGTTITAKVTNYQDKNANGVLRIEIVEDDNRVVASGDAETRYGVATLQFTAGITGGHSYKARAQAYGIKPGEMSSWSAYSASKVTAPPATQITALKCISNDTVQVSWDPAVGAKSYTVGYTSVVNSSGEPVFDTASGGQEQGDIKATYFIAASLALAKRWFFRVKAVNDGGESDWSVVKNKMLGTKPDKPTIWSYTTVGKIGTPLTLNWVHSSEDGSAQSGAVIGYKINDGAEQTIGTTANPVITTEQTYSFPTTERSDGDKISWRVRTRGTQEIDEEWGDYSEYREIVVYAPPAVIFSVGNVDPQEDYPVIRQFPIDIPIISTPETQTPVAYYVSITADQPYDISGEDGIEIHVSTDQEIYSQYIPTAEHSFTHTINPGDVYLASMIRYTVKVTVAMTNGLTAETEHKFIAKWDEYTWDPDADVEVDDETLTAVIRPYCADEWGFEYKEGIRFAVYRIDFDGQLTLIASDIDPQDNTAVTDLHPSLDYARYRIVATDLKTGVVFYDDSPAIPVNAKSAVIQWEGETRRLEGLAEEVLDLDVDWAGTILRLPYNVDVADDLSPDVALVEYIGRKHPVSYYGTQQGSTSRWTAEFKKSDTETLSKIRALAIYPGDVYVREPAGSGYWANVQVSYNLSHNKAAASVTFTITRVEGGA